MKKKKKKKKKKLITFSKEEMDKIIDISIKVACLLYAFSKIIEETNNNKN